MGLVNMKMSKEETKEQASPSDSPQYPFGLSINLDDDALEKLGIGDSMSIGDEVTITAKAKVTSKSGYETMVGDSENSIGLQITDMEVSGGASKAAKALYDK